MPGSYFPDFDHSTSPSLHLTTANARPPLFLPPTSPSATSSLSNANSTSLRIVSNSDYLGRKRVRRNEHSLEPSRTPRLTRPCKKVQSTPAQSSAIYKNVPESPAGFVNTRYFIAGGLDTPSAARLDAEERHEQDMRELDYRPNRTTFTAIQNSADHLPRTPAVGDNYGYVGRKRAHSSDQPGWSKVVVNLVGDVAGKVFNFCWNSAFRGFQAGGGQAYRTDSDTPEVIDRSTWMEIGEKDDVFNKHYQAQHYHQLTPVPGQFPEEGFIDDYMSQPQAYRASPLSTPVACGKGGGSTLRGSWVLLNDQSGLDERDCHSMLSPYNGPQTTSCHQRRTPLRPLPKAAGNRPRLAPSRPSLAGSPGCNVNRPASFASPRVSPGKSYSRETDSRPSRLAGHRRSRSSVASPQRGTDVERRQSFNTPNSPDVQRFEKKMRRKERKEDESIQRLNRQLQDMIKEGKEALETRIEIEDDTDNDEGYGEGTEVMEASKW